MFKILYLEDDINLSDTVSEFLNDNGFIVHSVYNSVSALDNLYKNNYDILLLDVNLPDISGFELLQQLRDAHISTPAIFITTLNDIDSLDKGYKIGADDYIKKPFELKELLHRINIILKRVEKLINNQVILANGIVFDMQNNTILVDDTNKIVLNNKENTLLKLLYRYKNKILPNEVIYDTLWSVNETYSEASVRTYIKNLRKIIPKEKIISYRKQGYKLVV